MQRSANYQITRKVHGLVRALAALVLVGSLNTLQSQTPQRGWEFSYGGPGEDQAQAILQTDDRGFILAGFSESFGTDNDEDVYLVRTDVDGQELWSQYHDLGLRERAFAMDKTDNGYILAGDAIINPLDTWEVLLMEVDLRGTVLWWNTYSLDGQAQALSVKTTTDGGFIVAGRTENASTGDFDMYILRTDNTGAVQWETTYGGPFNDNARGVIQTADGGFTVIGAVESTNVESDITFIHLDDTGNVQWEYTYESTGTFDEGYDLIEGENNFITACGLKDFKAFALQFDPNGGTPTLEWEWQDEVYDFSSEAYALDITNDGNIVIGGNVEPDGINFDAYMAKLTLDAGELIWVYNYGHPETFDRINDIVRRVDGGFALSGYDGQQDGTIGLVNDFLMMKAESDGLIRTNKVAGVAFFDTNENNVLDGDEAGLEDWLLKLEGDDVTYYATTNEEGRYTFTADTGVYDLQIYPKNGYWAPSTLSVSNVTVTGTYNLVEIDLPVQAAEDCPEMVIDISTEAVVACDTVQYTVNYYNQGTADATSVQALIELDPGLEYLSTTAPQDPAPFGDNGWVFTLPNLPQGGSNRFTFTALAECGVQDGTAFQVTGRISPDVICEDTPGWDEASIEVTGTCDGDNVIFTLSNNGIGDLVAPLDYIVIEDDIMGLSQPFTLDAGEEMEVQRPANGSTYRILLDQSPNHPGESRPSVAIERCGTNVGGTYSTGMVTMFPEDERNPFKTVDVQESLFTGNDVALKGYPFGYHGDTIAANVDIQYHVRFENTTDSVLKWIAFRDTLELDKLQISTLEAGSSSHPYDMEVYENGALKFKFYDINLEPGEKGFFQFKVSQQPDLAPGTEIFNKVEMFVGADEVPFLSNTKRHVIAGDMLQDFVIINDVNDLIADQYQVTIAPNPFSESTVITVEGWDLGQLQFQLVDALGRRVRLLENSTGQFELSKNGLSSGMYYFALLHDGQTVKTGKVIVR